MWKTTLPILILLSLCPAARAQVFPVDTLQYRGDSNKYINLVILGDGYTAAEQNKFAADAAVLSSYLLGQSPWSHYADYFNVFAIRVVSAQSGAKHPNTAPDCSTDPMPVSNPDTYLGCSFDSYGIHRLVVPTKISNVVSVLAANFPAYDQVLVIANSPNYGGSGGTFATSTTQPSSREISAHELGHAFAYLADEYYAGDQYALEKPNMTKESNPTQVKWKNWVGANNVGVFQHCCGGNSALWYKPHNGCKMQALGNPYCSVCAEALIEKIHALTNPIVAYTPQNATVNSSEQFLPFRLAELMKPVPNTLNIAWQLDGASLAQQTDSVTIDQSTLNNGAHTLAVSVTDTSTLLRVNNHTTLHTSIVSWTIEKTSSGVQVGSKTAELQCTLSPNPAGDWLQVDIRSMQNTPLSVYVLSGAGKMVLPPAGISGTDGHYQTSIDISTLPGGAFYLVVQLAGATHSQVFLKA